MRQLIAALVVAVAGIHPARADSPKKPGISNKSYGDGGGYKHPDAEVGQFFEIKPTGEKPAELKPDQPKLPAKIQPVKAVPETRPIAVRPSRPRPIPFAPIVTKTETAAKANDRAISEEMPLPNSVGEAADAASDDARRDYETRMLGLAPAPRRPGISDSTQLSPAETGQIAPAAVPTGEGMLFVSLELDASEAGSLRDAVAGLGEAAAFRPDARFQPLPGAGGSVRISGWLPASRLGSAISRPGVRRVSVERGSRPAGDDRLTGTYLLRLRVSDRALADESIAQSVRELSSSAGFKLERIYGVETGAGGGMTALVSGTMPVSQLSRALGLPGVLEVGSAYPDAEEASVAGAAAAVAKPAEKKGFVNFVMARGLWLVLLTLLLALPVISETAKRVVSVFVPYR